MSELPKPKWKKPSLEEEMEELERHAEESGINLDSLVTAFNSAELQELSDEDWMNMENCDSRDKTWTTDEVRKYLEGKRDFQKIEEGLKRGDTMPAPVVLYQKDHYPNLLAGNSRLLGCRALKIRPMVLALRLES